MKRGLKVIVSLSLLFVIGLPVFAQPNTKSIETFVMDNFDTPGDTGWDWGVQASRFVAEGYPKTGYYAGIPNSLKALRRPNDPDPQVFGVKVAYNRKGDNWFEVFPVKDGEKYEIPFIGTVSQVDFWVWGSNYLYFLDIIVRDGDGITHILPAGSLNFNGWRNIVVNIPGWLKQHSKLRSGRKNMTFVGYRIRSDAEEPVDDYVIFFDQIKYTTNSMALIYDGYDLNEVDFGDSNSSNTATVEE